MLPNPGALVAISGVAEVLGGVGLLVPRLRRPAMWGLLALLLAVFPANVNMALNREELAPSVPEWTLWARLPLQAVLAWLVWTAGRERRADNRAPGAHERSGMEGHV